MTDGDRLLRRIVGYGGGWTVTLGAAALLSAAAQLVLPAMLGAAVDAAIGDGPVWWAFAAVALLAVVAAGDCLADLSAGVGAARATARLRHRLLGHLLALDPRTAARRAVGDLVTRLVGQAADAGQAGTTVVLGLIALVPPVGSVIALGLIDPWLAVAFVVGLALLGLFLRAFVTDASVAMLGYQRTQGEIAGHLVDALAGARTIAAAGTADVEITRALGPLPRLGEHGRQTWRVLARAAGRTAAVAPLSQVAVIAVGGWALTLGRISTGDLVAAVQYAALGAGLGAVVSALNRLVRTRSGAHRAAEVLTTPARQHGTDRLPVGPGELVLRRVTVGGGPTGVPALAGVDLRLPGGRTVAVVGPSGAGKSTLAEVAGRLRDPDDGTVLLDGVDLRRLTADELTRAVGYGFERPVLVGSTVAEAIGLGAADLAGTGRRADLAGAAAPADADRRADLADAGQPADLAAVRRAARRAAIDDFVRRLPDGYHTPLADAPMSGGEAQRLGLARALRAERLLILDDATSSVDTATEQRIWQAVTGGPGGPTRLIITHRARTAAAADLVVWLERGRVRAVGPHERLCRDPDYRTLFQPVTAAQPAAA